MIRTKKQILLHLLAEIEALFMDFANSKPQQLAWRRRELNSYSVRFGKQLFIGGSFFILRPGGVSLGERIALGYNAQLFNHAPISIGDDFIGAADLIIDSGSHNPITLEPNSGEVRIGNRVWCGVRVTILAGVTIGNDIVIGAGSLVNKDIPSNSVAAGVPARVIRTIDRSTMDSVWTSFNHV